MGVYFEDKADKNKNLNISMWAWSYFLGLFEQSGVIPANLLRDMQSNDENTPIPFIPADVARKLGQRFREMLLGYMKEDKDLNNLPRSNSESATWAYGFIRFLTSDKGIPDSAIGLAPGKPHPQQLASFITLCETTTHGFEVC